MQERTGKINVVVGACIARPRISTRAETRFDAFTKGKGIRCCRDRRPRLSVNRNDSYREALRL